jgi:hypothetical protein
VIKSSNVQYDSSPAEPQIVGMCWYQPQTYAACLAIFDDRADMHDNYDDWLEFAELAEDEFKQCGVGVVRVLVEPESLVAWCRENGLDRVNLKARTI